MEDPVFGNSFTLNEGKMKPMRKVIMPVYCLLVKHFV